MLEDDLLVRIFGTDCTRKYRSFEALLRSRFELASDRGIRVRNRGGMLFHDETIRGILWASRKCAYAVRTIEAARCFPSFHAYDSAKFCAKLRPGIPWSSAFCLPLLIAIQFSTDWNFDFIFEFSLEIFEEIWGNWGEVRIVEEKLWKISRISGMLIPVVIGFLFALASRFNFSMILIFKRNYLRKFEKIVQGLREL